MVAEGLTDDAKDAAIDEALQSEIAAAVQEVENLPPPARASLFDDVYATMPWNLREQKDELEGLPRAPPHGG